MIFENYITNPYLRSLIIFFVLFFILRIFYSIVGKILLNLALKTKTNVDDIILKKSTFPVTILLFLISINVAINELPVSIGINNAISKIVYSLITIIIAFIIFIFIDVAITRALNKITEKTKTKINGNLVSLLHGIIKVILIILVLLYILSVWGVEILPLLGALGIAGLAVALALQPTLGNIFSGISIILDKTASKGELIYLDNNIKGIVDRIGLRSTRIITFDNELIIVPNSKLADSIIRNVALPEPKSRVVIKFTIAYGSDISKVKKIIIDEIKKIKNVIDEPNVRFLEMADSSLNFKVYFYVHSYENKFDAIDEANTKIYNILRKNKISIPYPQLDVHLKK